jgi:hypothetical protein
MQRSGALKFFGRNNEYRYEFTNVRMATGGT